MNSLRETAAKRSLPPLPDEHMVASFIHSWSSRDPDLAVMLDSGIPAATALTRLALVSQQSGRITEAGEFLRFALALAPDDPVLWTNYGVALSQADSHSNAAECLEHSLSLMPSQPDTWIALGVARSELGDFAAAESAYRKALEQLPDSLVAWQLLSLLKEQQKDFAGAIDCVKACIESGAQDPALFAYLGKLCHQLGRMTDAYHAYSHAAQMEESNPHYRLMARKSGFLHSLILGDSIESAMIGFDYSFSPESAELGNELSNLLNSSFSLLSGFGYLDAAAKVGRKQVELWPDHPSAYYLLQAISGDAALDRSPQEYVVRHFDSFAEGFESQLVGSLGYDIPRKLCAAIEGLSEPGKQYDTLDAGCGTGLCGPLLRSRSRCLIGIDISSKMLEQARLKAVYDELASEDLTSYLQRSPARFDLIVAADVMVYFGDLSGLISMFAGSLRAGGLLAISTEGWAGPGYKVLPSGRFAHAAGYVRGLAASHFQELACIETTIRLEANRKLPGNIFIFRNR